MNNFVVATPGRSVCDQNARALYNAGALKFLALGTRNGTAGVPPEFTRLNPKIGLAAFAATRVLSVSRAESFRFRLHPWFDRWVKKQLAPGDHIISSYGYANASFRHVRQHGGKTFLDAGNSHPENSWAILSDEYARWNCSLAPMAPHHFARAQAMLAEVDYVLSPSAFVTNSFLQRGFKPEQIFKNIYPVDLGCFTPATTTRPANRPLTIINTGAVSLRKGTPYLLEAFKLVLREHPTARLKLIDIVQDEMRPILKNYADLPIDWSPPMSSAQLADHLRGADIFVLPSLEEGLARTALEAMACGLPVILTPNTGTADFVQPGVNGEVVPIRDARAIADAISKWSGRVMTNCEVPKRMLDADQFSFETFERDFISQLRCILPQA